MITYRTGKYNDASAVARLHAESWRHHYRGMLSDHFLDGPVWENRTVFWQTRLQHPDPHHYLILSEHKERLCGFSCLVADHDSQYGALLDNLHVLPGYQGKGIGKMLLRKSAHWLCQEYPESSMYLWVFEKNESARDFYRTMGGIHKESLTTDQIDGSTATICRYVWPDISMLIDLQ